MSWKTALSRKARAMLHAGDLVIVGGRDAEGGFLHAFAAHDGTVLGEQQLEASPVWDGLAAAAGRLYVPLENGSLVCLGEN